MLYPWLLKSDRLFIFSLFLINFHCNVFWTTSATEFVRTVFRSLIEGSTITTKFLKCHICNTSCIEINTLFAICNSNCLGNFKVGPNHVILKVMDAGSWKVFPSMNAMELVKHTLPLPRPTPPHPSGWVYIFIKIRKYILSKEFYECFWNETKNPFLASIHKAFLNQEVSSSQKQGVIKIIKILEKKIKTKDSLKTGCRYHCLIQTWKL